MLDSGDGLRVILTQGLQVERSHEVLVLYDETTSSFIEPLTTTLIDLQANTTFTKIPMLLQESLSRRLEIEDPRPLPRTLMAALFEATTILNILSGALELKPFRAAILRSPRRPDARFAHVPGFSNEIVDCVAKTDLREVSHLCADLALVLGEARSVTLHTPPDNSLSISLTPWEEEPIQSPGIIHPGSWGNIPPGETFICPDCRDVRGTVRVDGSVPGLILDAGEHVLLRFEDGRLRSWETTSQRLGKFFADRQDRAMKCGDMNWNCIAEIGIGANRSIKSLTGNALFDEKVYGTVHLALGDNKSFGRSIRSEWHGDLVMREVELRVDDLPVVKEQRVIEDVSEWIVNASELQPTPLARCADRHFMLSKVAISDGRLLRRLSSGGRVSYIQMGDGVTTRALADLYGAWDSDHATDLAQECERRPVIGGIEALRLVACLEHFRVLTVR